MAVATRLCTLACDEEVSVVVVVLSVSTVLVVSSELVSEVESELLSVSSESVIALVVLVLSVESVLLTVSSRAVVALSSCVAMAWRAPKGMQMLTANKALNRQHSFFPTPILTNPLSYASGILLVFMQIHFVQESCSSPCRTKMISHSPKRFDMMPLSIAGQAFLSGSKLISRHYR